MHPKPHLCLRVGVLACSLLLVSGLIAYQTGYLSYQRIKTNDPQKHSIDFNSIGTKFSQPNAEVQTFKRNEPLDGGRPRILDVPLLEVGSLQITGYNEVDSLGPIVQAAPPAVVLSVTSPQSLQAVQERGDQSTNNPGQASATQIRRDALTLMAGSKSFVLMPSTPVEFQKAEDNFRAKAARFFSMNDRNGDGKLTKEELHDDFWKELVKTGAIENDTVDADGILKNYLAIERVIFRNSK